MPREPLSRDRVLRAALEIVDESGVTGVSMRAVAARLEVEAMSLYHHVANKQDLLDGLVDLVVRTARLPTEPADAADWVRGAADGWRSLARQHPRWIALLTARTLPLADPLSAEPFEAGLAAFTRAGHDLKSAFSAVQSTSLALLAMTELEAAGALLDDPERDASGIDGLDPERFPLLHGVLTQAPEVEDLWDFMVETLVLGLERRPARSLEP